MENLTNVKGNKAKKVTSKETKKIDLLQLSEAIKAKVTNVRGEKESIYIYKDSEVEKANNKLNSFIKKNEGKEVATKDKRKLKLSFHLSGARTNIRNEFEKLIINYFEVVGSNKLSDKDNKELINL